jgi:hypothetical protein
MSDPLLRIGNHHASGCGDPPIVNSDDPDLYIGYFENPDGDQWVFTFHRTSRKAELRGGDIGWNEIKTVENGRVADLILGEQERAWLQACWRAACGSE